MGLICGYVVLCVQFMVLVIMVQQPTTEKKQVQHPQELHAARALGPWGLDCGTFLGRPTELGVLRKSSWGLSGLISEALSLKFNPFSSFEVGPDYCKSPITTMRHQSQALQMDVSC